MNRGKKMKRVLVFICAVCLMFTAAADQERYAPKVLMYHLVLEEPYSPLTGLFVRPSEFENQVGLLTERHYEFLFAEEYDKTAVPSVLLTFDDGYVDNYTEVLPILQKYGAKATVFLIADLVDRPGYLSTEQITEMSESGLVSFQSHTKTHRDLTTLSPDETRVEFQDSKLAIEAITGKPVKALSYPQGQYTDRLAIQAKDYFSVAYITKAREGWKRYVPYTIPRLTVERDFGMEEFKKLLH